MATAWVTRHGVAFPLIQAPEGGLTWASDPKAQPYQFATMEEAVRLAGIFRIVGEVEVHP